MIRRVLSGGLAFVALAAGLAVPGSGAAVPDPSPQTLASLGTDIFTELNLPASRVTLAYTGVDPKANVVEIGVVNLNPGIERRLREQYGAERIRVVAARPLRQTMLKVRKTDAPLYTKSPKPGVTPQDAVGLCPGNALYCAPTRGGVYLQQDAGGGFVGICSSTIVGTSRAGRNATLTAGHCFSRAGVQVLYGTWTLGAPPAPAGGQLGVPGDRRFSGSSDHLVIPWNNPFGAAGRDFLNNCVFVPGVDCQRMNFNAAISDMPVGTEVVQRGYTTQLTQGRIVLNSANANVGGVPLSDVVVTSACSLPGDSGGAAFVRGDRLVGTISGGNFINESPPRCDPNPITILAKATNAFANLGFSPRLRP